MGRRDPGQPYRVIYFPTSSERDYRLDFIPDVGGVWTQISGQENVSGSGGTDSLQDTNVPAAQGLYRVRVRMP